MSVRSHDRLWDRSTAARLVVSFVIWGYAILSILTLFGSPVGQFDDAIPLVGGLLVQRGKTPNLDFFTGYPPLGNYLHAVAFHFLGLSVISSRVISAGLYLLALALTIRLFGSRIPDRRGLTPLAVLVVAASIQLNTPSWPGFAFSLVALEAYLLSLDLTTRRLPAIALCGSLTSAAILYRVNFGGYVAIVVALDVLADWWLLGRTRWSSKSLRTLASTAAAFAVPLVICSVAAIYGIYGRNTGRAIAEFGGTAQRHMLRFINLRYSPELSCFVMLPSAYFVFRILRGKATVPPKALQCSAVAIINLLVVLIFNSRPTIAWIGMALQLGSVVFLHLFIRRLCRTEMALLMFFCCQLQYYLGRADEWHDQWLVVVAALLIPFFLAAEGEKGLGGESELAVPMGTAAAIMVTVFVVLSAKTELRPRRTLAWNGAKLLVTRIRDRGVPDNEVVLGADPTSPAWSTVYDNQSEIEALRYVRAQGGPNTPLFVGSGDHSSVYYSDVRAYWLAGLPVGVRTFEFEPGQITEAPVQIEMISDLERNRVLWIILDYFEERGDDTFAERAYRGSVILDQYIRAHYQERKRFGRYGVLNRIEESDAQQYDPGKR